MKWAVAILVVALTASVHAQDAPRVLTLDEAIRLALAKNPDLATAQQRIAAARAGLRQADAAFWPQVRVSESYAASDNPVQAFMMTLNQRAFNFGANFNHPETTDNLNTKILAQWSLYDGGRNVATRQAARLGAEATEQSLAAVRNDLVFEVTRAFHTIGKARQFIAAAAAAVNSMASNVNVASNRFSQGAVLKSDLLDAEVRLAEARENLVRARNALALSETVFRNVLGVGEDENVTAGDGGFGSDQAVPPGGAAGRAPANELVARPELLAAQKAVAAVEKQVRIAASGNRPHLHAFASYDLDSGDARHYANSWVGGVSVELNVFDGFLTRGQVAEARAHLAATREQLRKLELAIQFEVKQARLNLDEAQARLETTTHVVAQAEESRQITKDRYANGLALLTQLLDAETAVTSARQRRAAAKADYLIALAALDRALGKSWKE